MRATMILKHEHRVIEQVLNCLERLAGYASRDRRVAAPAANDAIDFFRHFADHCHHAKEEDLLFPLLEEKGFSPQFGPTAVMRGEHEQGREHIRAMSEAVQRAERGDAAAVDQFVEHARGYVELLRNHIEKEDHCLFAMADQVLTESDDESLRTKFDRAEEEVSGHGCHAAYEQLADRLADDLAVPRVSRSASEAAHVGACAHASHVVH